MKLQMLKDTNYWACPMMLFLSVDSIQTIDETKSNYSGELMPHDVVILLQMKAAKIVEEYHA